jgi:hypothetical protein
MNTGKIGPMMTVGIPSKTNPANSSVSSPVRAGGAIVVAIVTNHFDGP